MMQQAAAHTKAQRRTTQPLSSKRMTHHTLETIVGAHHQPLMLRNLSGVVIRGKGILCYPVSNHALCCALHVGLHDCQPKQQGRIYPPLDIHVVAHTGHPGQRSDNRTARSHSHTARSDNHTARSDNHTARSGNPHCQPRQHHHTHVSHTPHTAHNAHCSCVAEAVAVVKASGPC
jgi:hypothetical protein